MDDLPISDKCHSGVTLKLSVSWKTLIDELPNHLLDYMHGMDVAPLLLAPFQLPHHMVRFTCVSISFELLLFFSHTPSYAEALKS